MTWHPAVTALYLSAALALGFFGTIQWSLQ